MMQVSSNKPNPEMLSQKMLKNDSNKKEKLFLRSYSELLSRHFNQSTKEKSQLRKKTHHQHKQRPKTIGQNKNQSKSRQRTDQLLKLKIKNQSTFQSSLNLNRKTSQNKLNPSRILLNGQLSKEKSQPNPESNQTISRILISKAPQIQKNSYENVILNKKLYQTTVQKNDLINLVETLKMEILKEKKNKSKISTKMAKLMNKIEETNTLRKKVQNQRNFINDETQTFKKDISFLSEKHKHLQLISSTNQERINTEKQLIEELQKNIQTQKISLYETKVYLNEMKSIYMQESKLLANTQANFDQTLSERQKMFYVVQSSVANARPSSKS